MEMLYESMRNFDGVELRTRFVGLRLITNTFQGKDLQQWLMKKYEIPKSSTLQTAQKLLDLQFFCAQGKDNKNPIFSSDVIYKCYEDIIPALNTKTDWSGEVRPANEVIDEMRRLLLDIESHFIAPSGKEVDYNAIANSKSFKTYKVLNVYKMKMKVY